MPIAYISLRFRSIIRENWTPEHDMDASSEPHHHRKRNSKAFLIESLVKDGPAQGDRYRERETELDNYHQRPYKRVKLERSGVGHIDSFAAIPSEENALSPVQRVRITIVTRYHVAERMHRIILFSDVV